MTTPQTNGMAIASLVLGIASIAMCLGPFAAIPALITGYKARTEIDRTGGVQEGRAMAVAGIVLGWVGAALTVILIVGAVVLAVLSNSTSTTTSSSSGSAAAGLSWVTSSAGGLTLERWAKISADWAAVSAGLRRECSSVRP